MGRGRPQKYPWAKWLDGGRHVLNSQEDFPGVSKVSFRQQALNEAARRGIVISTESKTVKIGGQQVDYVLIKSREAPKMKRIVWDDLFAAMVEHGGVVLRRDRDFGCSTEAMRVRIYQAAQRRGLLPVTITTDGDAVSIYPQNAATGMAPQKQEATP